MVTTPGSEIFDVTVPFSSDLPVWPGDPAVSVEPARRIAAGGNCNVSEIRCSSHVGTHVDPPWHFDDQGARLNEVPIERWIGPCLVVAMPDDVRRIEPAQLERAAIPHGTERLLFRTSNARLWRPGKLAFDESYVALTPAAARWVVEHGIRLVGIDYLSIEVFDDVDHATHRILLSHGVLIVEGLDLTDVAPGPYQLICLPLKLAAGDGAPARVLLVREP